MSPLSMNFTEQAFYKKCLFTSKLLLGHTIFIQVAKIDQLIEYVVNIQSLGFKDLTNVLYNFSYRSAWSKSQAEGPGLDQRRGLKWVYTPPTITTTQTVLPLLGYKGSPESVYNLNLKYRKVFQRKILKLKHISSCMNRQFMMSKV